MSALHNTLYPGSLRRKIKLKEDIGEEVTTFQHVYRLTMVKNPCVWKSTKVNGKLWRHLLHKMKILKQGHHCRKKDEDFSGSVNLSRKLSVGGKPVAT